MKGRLGSLQRGRTTMRTHLVLSFSVPVLLVLVVVLVCVHWVLLSRTVSQQLSLVESSYKQAFELVSSYVNTMLYASNTICYNGELQDILGDPDYTQERPMDDRYREFLELDNVFSMAENMDAIYRASVFLEDAIPYTNNQVHIVPLEELDVGEELLHQLEQENSLVFLPSRKLTTPGSDQTAEVVTLFRSVRTLDRSSRQICVMQVCMLSEKFQQAVRHAMTTPNAFVYLSDGSQSEIASTDSELYRQLDQEELLTVGQSQRDWGRVEVAGKRYYVRHQELPQVSWTLTAMVPVADIYAQSRYVTAVFVTLGVLVLAAVVSVAILLANSYTRRLKHLKHWVQRIRSGDLEADRGYEPGGDEIGDLFNSFQEMEAELQNLMRVQYRLGKEVKSAELCALQAQINPHFLYNTLDLINWDAFEHDAPEISEIVQNLAKFYRLSLNRGRPILTVREELEHVQAYVSIENRHFDDAIHLHIQVPSELMELACLNIILQPFVENSIIHGFGERFDLGVGNIWIEAEREGDDLLFCVRDDGAGMTEAQIEAAFQKNTSHQVSGYGIKNIQSRIHLCFGEPYGVSYQHPDSGGTLAVIRIPALTLEEAEKRLENM